MELKLIKKAQRGNSKAFLELFQAHEVDIYKMAFIYMKNEDDALEVVQETACRSFKKVSSLKEPRYFKTWLLRIAINSSIDLLRKKNMEVQFEDNIKDYIPIDVNEDIDLEITVKDLIDHLNESEKSVVILRFYEDLTLKEISHVLDLSLGTVKTILYRALEKLRKNIERGGFNEQ
ncbi:sigma-70 family RNA polymerase sigma factor [Alkalicoccobacillus plakortidis]|uniref:Sigma-70 family RNA polymerase sigma factor n=1 Tax=Alkalicoccobacillus plakortidis TaxID=444060 RepID=A0ABT0XFY3_9BACI|nr:sigma-70 family RNA polymerase sigma factor [Alkalicoccobacillus plakortidis]MCM2674263.1 sigma-70 family RNA polymerase sigma factor [Alkalicoccobacillus plakortidis]